MSDKQPHRADDSITLISGALAAQRTAADACEDSFRRLAFNTSAACDGLLSAVSSVNDYVCKTVNDIRGKAKRMCAWRDKRLEWLWEELDGSQAQLEAWGRQLCVSGEVVIDWESIEESTRTAELFLGGVDLHPASSTVIFAREVSPVLAVAGMSHTQQCIDVIQSPVSHPRFFQRGERNSVGVVCRDAAGYAVRNLRVSDVRLRVNDEEAGWAVSEPTVEVGSLNVYVTPAKGASRTVALILDIDGVIIEIPLQVCSCRCR